jgi:hypothetical protein
VLYQQLTKKSFVSVSSRGEDAVHGLPALRRARAGLDEDRHFGRRQGQQLSPIDQQLLGRQALLTADIVAEAVSGRFERREGVDVGLLLRRVHAPRRERDFHVVPGGLRGFLNRRAAARTIRSASKTFPPVAAVEVLLDRFERLQHL